MKKYLRSILCLLLALCMVMCFVACDKDEDDEKKKEAKGPSGTYYIYKMTVDDEEFDRDQLEEAGIDYKDFSITFNDDGTGEFNELGDVTEFEWDEDVLTADGDDLDYTYEDGKITIAVEDREMTFAK